MSQEILPQAFDNPEFGQLRVIQDESGEPWFVAKDVCDALGLGRQQDSTRYLDDDEKGECLVNTPSGNQRMVTVSEAGLYSLVMRSRKPEAKEFRRWVTHEVIPSIRRTGGYMVARADETPEQLLARALKLADATLRERDARIASLTPRAEFYDATMKGERWMSVTEAARQLHQYDHSITRKDVFAFCMQRHIITSDKQASKLGIDRGYVANYQPPAYFDQTTGEMVRPKPYAKVTSKGFTWLLEGMCGQRRLPDAG